MAAGLGLLRLDPRAFWAMTPKELAVALRPLDGRRSSLAAPGRRELERLMRAFPDV